ncbi:MAG: hypothetical protein ACI8T6_000766 [Candidatus Poseidoniaceae archaeon]|jgi:hypothetical protein
MAKGWRGLLEEESEHQWLAITGFFVFIIIGALAIQGTSSLPGVEYRSNGLDAVDGRVLDIIYGDSGTYTALILGDEGGIILHQDDAGILNDIGANYDDVLGMTFMTELHDGSIVVSPSNNTLEIIHVNAEVSQRTILPLNSNQEVFDVVDVAEQPNGDSYRWLMVTDEGDSTSLRGFGSVGSELLPAQDAFGNATLTAAMVNSGNIAWNMVEALDDGTWIAIGLTTNAFGADEDSPAAPIKHPVIGFISWSAGPTSPMLTSIEELDKGEIHSLVRLDNGTLLAAGTDSAVHIAKDRTTTTVDFSSVSATLDENGAVWLFGSAGSTSVVRMVDGVAEKMPLAQPLLLTIETSDVSNDVVYAYGINANGDAATYSIDTLAIGSIESGRGFLNFLFVTASTVVIGVMLWTASKRIRQNQ